MRAPAALVGLVLAAVTGAKASAQDLNWVIALTQTVAKPCAGDGKKQISSDLTVTLPNEVALLYGPTAVITPLTATVDDEVHGNGGTDALVASHAGLYTVTSGIAGGQVQIHIQLARRLLCDAGHKLVFDYGVVSDSGANLAPGLRVTLRPGGAAVTQFGTGGRAIAITALDKRFGARLRYHLSDAFLWHREHETVLASEKPAPVTDFCFKCRVGETYDVETTFAHFLDDVSPGGILSNATGNVLGGWSGSLTFLATDRVRLSYAGGGWVEFTAVTPTGASVRDLYISKLQRPGGGSAAGRDVTLISAPAPTTPLVTHAPFEIPGLQAGVTPQPWAPKPWESGNLIAPGVKAPNNGPKFKGKLLKKVGKALR